MMNEELRCAALRDDGECGALSFERCQGYKRCSFYRTNSEQALSNIEGNERLNALPDEQQREIADKYYSGKMPWKPIIRGCVGANIRA